MAEHNLPILVVEDDQSLREAIGDTLELAGRPYIAVGGGEEALKVLAEQAHLRNVILGKLVAFNAPLPVPSPAAPAAAPAPAPAGSAPAAPAAPADAAEPVALLR